MRQEALIACVVSALAAATPAARALSAPPRALAATLQDVRWEELVDPPTLRLLTEWSSRGVPRLAEARPLLADGALPRELRESLLLELAEALTAADAEVLASLACGAASARVRAWALARLPRAPSPEGRTCALGSVGAEVPAAVEIAAVEALGTLGGDGARETLTARLDAPLSDDLAEAVILALGKLGDARSVALLAAVGAGADVAVAATALHALALLPGEEASAALASAAQTGPLADYARTLVDQRRSGNERSER